MHLRSECANLASSKINIENKTCSNDVILHVLTSRILLTVEWRHFMELFFLSLTPEFYEVFKQLIPLNFTDRVERRRWSVKHSRRAKCCRIPSEFSLRLDRGIQYGGRRAPRVLRRQETCKMQVKVTGSHNLCRPVVSTVRLLWITLDI